MPRLSLSLLGPKLILLDGKLVGAFTYNRSIALLAYLAVEAGFPHSRQELVGLLWPDLPNAAALTNLRQVLADLRRVLADETTSPPFLLITRESIQFNPNSDFQLDTTTFLHTLSSCESHRHRHIDRCRICQARLEAALPLYRGDFLSGFSIDGAAPFEEWVAYRREQFHQRAQQLLHHLVNFQLRSRNEEKAQRYLRRQVALEPWNEEAHQQLMRLYARNGQRSNALLQFDSCQRILRVELGVEPASLTQTLHAQLRAGLPLAEETTAQPRKVWHNLPLAATSLVGRNKELAQLGELLGDPTPRLITILGPGGIGKTRLALAAAENAVAFGNGVLFVSLAGMSDVHFLPNAIIAALDTPLPNRLTPQEQLLTFLRDQELLLLLDNYEQFLPDVSFLTQLLRSAPAITILVTSRERLAMQAEHLIELAGLDYPRTVTLGTSGAANITVDEYSALQLFVQRVRQVQRNFASTTTDVAAILRIGRITEGMPLALELAAAGVRSHSCVAIANALESGQQLLATQMRDLPERQRSMQAVFVHSMRLLSVEEHQAFCALSLFRGGFIAEAAEEVAHAPLPMLAALVDKSLLRMTHTDGPTYRYDMHELMRQFAERELAAGGPATEVRKRYQAYFMALAKAANAGLVGAQPGIWIARLEPEIDNLRTVLQALRRETPEAALRMAFDLYWFWHSRSYLQEGLDWLVGLSSLDAPVSPLLRAEVYRAASFFALCLNKVEEALAWITKSLALFQTLDMTDRQNAEGYIYALTRFTFVYLYQGEYEQALAVSREARQLARKLNSKFHVSLTLYGTGEAYCMQEKYDEARQSYEESLPLMQEVGDLRAIGQRLGRLANVAAAQGGLAQARLLCREALTTCTECQDHVGLTMALLVAVRLANLDGDYPRAALLLGATETILDANPIVRTWPQDQRSYNGSVAILRAHLDADIFEQQWAKGRTLSLEQTVTLALSSHE
jgi:predicted ATPase/DNA-binding SARP family transcriptional activator